MCRDITSELDIIGPLTAPVVRAHGGPVFPAGLGNTILLAQSWLREAPLVVKGHADLNGGGHEM